MEDLKININPHKSFTWNELACEVKRVQAKSYFVFSGSASREKPSTGRALRYENLT